MLSATAVSLAVPAALLAWPVPARLARARWPRRDPLVALVCWQAIELVGVLLLLPFVAWEGALPVLPAAARAHAAVRELVEMRADDVALASLSEAVPRRTLARAIVAAAGGAGGLGVPTGALAVTGGATRARVVRLLEPPSPLTTAARWTALASAGLLLLLSTALLLLPAL
jgi:hypothetical protein